MIYLLVIIVSAMNFRNKVLLFWILTTLALFYIFYYVYVGADYHFYFFYIYLIIAYWISKSNKKFFVICFILLSLLYCFKKPMYDYYYTMCNNENIECVLSEIKDADTVYCTVFRYIKMLPYISKDIVLKDYNNESLISYNNFHTIWSVWPQPNYDKLIQVAPPNSYLLITSKDKTLSIFINKYANRLDVNKYNTKCGNHFIYKLR